LTHDAKSTQIPNSQLSSSFFWFRVSVSNEPCFNAFLQLLSRTVFRSIEFDLPLRRLISSAYGWKWSYKSSNCDWSATSFSITSNILNIDIKSDMCIFTVFSLWIRLIVYDLICFILVLLDIRCSIGWVTLPRPSLEIRWNWFYERVQVCIRMSNNWSNHISLSDNWLLF